MHNSEIIPALIAKIRRNNTDNVIIRSKLYNLLNNVTSKFNDVTKATPYIVDFQNMSNDKVLEHYYLSIGAESLWNARELIMKAIREQNKLINEDYNECKAEKDRVNQIQKTRNNTVEKLKNLVLDAVLMFGTTSKSGNKVIEAPTYKLFSRNVNSYSPKDFFIADIIKEFYYCIGEYLDEVSTLDSLDLEFLAQVISAQLTAYKIADLEAANQSFDKDEIGIEVSKDDLLAIPAEITINISLSDLAKEENLPLVKWINEHPHKVNTVHKVTSSLIKTNLDMNANLHIYDIETKTSLTIK